MNAYIYLRVSTPRQAREGVSISRENEEGFQEERCRELCKYKGWTVVDPPYIDAGMSGRSKGLKKRDALARAVKAACADGGVVVMYALARLSRSARDLYNLTHELEQAGAHFATTREDIDTSKAMGKAFFGLCAVFAQLESDQISERKNATCSHLTKKLGFNPMCKQPYGWRYEGGQRVEVPEEQIVIAKAIELRRIRRGPCGPPMSVEKIAGQLTMMGYRTRSGAIWHPAEVRRLLIRAGLIKPQPRIKNAPAGGTQGEQAAKVEVAQRQCVL